MIHYQVKKNYEEISQAAAQEIIAHVKKNPTGLYCFAGGDTPVRTLELLAEAHLSGDIDFSQASFIELDEWIGIDPENSGSCASYLNRHLFSKINIQKDQLHLFNPLSTNLKEECQSANRFIQKQGGISLVLLGIGENGHLGFNEPGTSLTAEAHLVALTASTKEVGKKYFADEKQFEQGISLGLGQLLRAEKMLIMASGPKKATAVQQILKGKTTSEWPVTAIWQHASAYLLVDEAAVAD